MTSILTILMWGAIKSSGVSFSGEFMLLDSNPSLKNVYIILEVTWVKSGGQGDLHFDNFDVRLNIVK